jgi:hypothetical protein
MYNFAHLNYLKHKFIYIYTCIYRNVYIYIYHTHIYMSSLTLVFSRRTQVWLHQPKDYSLPPPNMYIIYEYIYTYIIYTYYTQVWPHQPKDYSLPSPTIIMMMTKITKMMMVAYVYKEICMYIEKRICIFTYI